MYNKLENKKLIDNIYIIKDLNDINTQINSEVIYVNENGFIFNKTIDNKKPDKLLRYTASEKIFIVINIPSDYSITNQKKIIFNIIKIFNYCNEKKIKIGNLIDDTNVKCAMVVENIDFDYSNIINSIRALLIDDIRVRYEFIYDTVCNQLDNNFALNNYCDFKCDKCTASRAKKAVHETMGCCYSFDFSIWKGVTNVQLCRYLVNNKCTINCMACKLFTCKYLKDKGINFKTTDIPLLACFFNKKQREILTANFFIDKPFIIDKLLEKNHTPYPLYYLFDCCRIKTDKINKPI